MRACGRYEVRQARHLLVLSLLMVALSLGVLVSRAQQTAAEAAREAEAAYQRGEYARAIALYEQLLAAGLRDGALYYNLGCAYFEAGDLGRAMLNFRRASVLNPRSAEVNRALALARALRVDIQGDETAPIDTLAAATIGLLTPLELGWLALLAWVIWCMLLMLAVLLPVWRGRLRWALAGWGAVLLLSAVLLVGRVYAETARPSAVVTAFLAPVMSGPGDDYLEIFDLYAAAELRILEARGDWARLLLPDGRQGWIALVNIERVGL
jgi:tetratricopeptide (TPR) repeat protein